NKRQYKQFAALKGGAKLKMPVALTVVESNVYLVDSLLHRVCVFDRNGKFLFSFGAKKLKRPSGIAYLANEEMIYVTDTAQHTIQVFNKEGGFLHQIGSRGFNAGFFNFPTHLWIDSSGRLYERYT
ncbi:MAG: 6-bladed beta-propeller, partial [Planctomycetota bacterium]